MEFRLSAEQELWKNTVREFAERELEPIARKIDEEWERIPDEVIQKMADLGIFGVTIPEEYGGMAMPGEEMQYAVITIHELARAELSMSVPVYTLLCIGWPMLLVHYGTEEAKQEILPKVAAGEWFLGINTTEPGGGSDLANIKTVGKDAGDKWIINGEKAYIKLAWTSGYTLKPDEYYEVVLRYTHRGAPEALPVRVQGTSWFVDEDLYLQADQETEFIYYWSVRLVRKVVDAEGKETYLPLSPASEERSFYWK